jgi:hypothetical protein
MSLSEEKRELYINKLVDDDFEFIMNIDSGELLYSYLTFGFKGYYSYTDLELKAEIQIRDMEA